MKPSPLAVLLASLTCGALGAQSIPLGGNLVGNVSPSGPAISLAGIVYRQDIGTCGAPVRIGSSLTMPLTAPGGGGAAYDAARQALWLSDGKSIVLKDLTTLTETCKFTPTLTGGSASVVTGLAHSNRHRQLIQLELFTAGTGNSIALRFYDTTQCPPAPLNTTCTIPLASGNTPSVAEGLEYDEVRDIIYYSVSTTGIAGVSSAIHHVPFQVACLVQSTVFGLPLMSPCGGVNSAVTGLAYDSCSRILYVTEGSVTLMMDLTNLANPINLNASTPCCPFGVKNQLWSSLAYVPKSTKTSIGTSCTDAKCGSCGSMKFDINGDLALGNKALSLGITGAPAGGSASLFLSLGKALVPGIALPGLCGMIHTPVGPGLPILVGAFPLGGSGGCTGSLQVPTVVPVDPGLCSVDLCAQFLVLCSGGGAGLTNAVEFRVGS